MYMCKGLCRHFEANQITGHTRYQSGQKRCSTCSIFINFQGARCPCCQTKLRLRSRLNQKEQPEKQMKKTSN